MEIFALLCTGGWPAQLASRVAPAKLTRLRQALPAAGWHDLTAEDGTVALDFSKDVYVLVDHAEHRVGFGT